MIQTGLPLSHRDNSTHYQVMKRGDLRKQTATPAPIKNPDMTVTCDTEATTPASIEDSNMATADVQQPVIATEQQPPPPVGNTRPTRIRNPPSRLHYWTPGTSVPDFPYSANMNKIGAFVEPYYPGVMPAPPCSLIPNPWQPTLPYFYLFTIAGQHCPCCGIMLYT